MRSNFQIWVNAVCEQVRFRPDHRSIEFELRDHYEEHVRDLLRLGRPRELAEDLERRLTRYTGHPPAVVESAGPCITINGGPQLVAFCCLSRTPRGEFGITGKLYHAAESVAEAAVKTAAAAAGTVAETAAKTAAAAAKAGEELLKNVADKLGRQQTGPEEK